MFEFIQRFFGRPSSSVTAKERLRLVLLSDHLSLAPEVVDALKHDLIEVISRYCDVDIANCDVTFEHQDKQIAMLANIPILGMRDRARPPADPPVAPPRAPEPPPVLGTAAATTSPSAPQSQAEPVPAQAPAAEPKPKPARKRRRRRPNAAPGTNGTTPAVSGAAGVSSI
ncbi:MAG: cell division topological specificity factor MinE [Candidatus Elarobacter sp.]